MGYAELKHHSRQECPEQGRDSYVPPPGDPAPCYLNEKTCTSFYNSTGMGRSINITYDWKHFMYEDYDRWLYNRRGLTTLSTAGFSWALCHCAKMCCSINKGTPVLVDDTHQQAAQSIAHILAGSRHHASAVSCFHGRMARLQVDH